MNNKKLKKYESIIIIKGSYTEAEYQEALEKIKEYVKELTEFEDMQEMGLKRLAYQVKEYEKGYFVIFHLKATSDDIVELERKYRITESILKFMTVRKED